MYCVSTDHFIMVDFYICKKNILGDFSDGEFG